MKKFSFPHNILLFKTSSFMYLHYISNTHSHSNVSEHYQCLAYNLLLLLPLFRAYSPVTLSPVTSNAFSVFLMDFLLCFPSRLVFSKHLLSFSNTNSLSPTFPAFPHYNYICCYKKISFCYVIHVVFDTLYDPIFCYYKYLYRCLF